MPSCIYPSCPPCHILAFPWPPCLFLGIPIFSSTLVFCHLLAAFLHRPVTHVFSIAPSYCLSLLVLASSQHSDLPTSSVLKSSWASRPLYFFFPSSPPFKPKAWLSHYCLIAASSPPHLLVQESFRPSLEARSPVWSGPGLGKEA